MTEIQTATDEQATPWQTLVATNETVLVLTGRQIRDLALFAGFDIDEKCRADQDLLETEYTLQARGAGDPPFALRDPDEPARVSHHMMVANLTEYPEEGTVGLGEEVPPPPPLDFSDPEKTITALLLTSFRQDRLEWVPLWTDHERQQAEVWAAAVHLRASDNPEVEVPYTPDHVRPHLQPSEWPYRTCSSCGCHDTDCRLCIERTGEACHWRAPDLCSACDPKRIAAHGDEL